MLVRHIAIVPEEAGVRSSELAAVSAAIQTQIVRDFAPIWGITATVDAFPSLEEIPAGYWPVLLSFRQLGANAGVYLDSNGQPYALVEMSPSWGIAASHLCLELLHDPFGNQTALGPSPHGQGAATYFMGICDPCADARYAYPINEVLVSDFTTPAYWGIGSGSQFSFRGNLSASFALQAGGHLYFHEPVSNLWHVRRQAGEDVTDESLGVVAAVGNLREALEARDGLPLAVTQLSLEDHEQRMGLPRQRAAQAAQYRAFRLRSGLALRPQLDGAAPETLRLEHEVRAALSSAPSRQRKLPAASEEPIVEVTDAELHTVILDRVIADPVVAADPPRALGRPVDAPRVTSVPPPLPVSSVAASNSKESASSSPAPDTLGPVGGSVAAAAEKRATGARRTRLYTVGAAVAALTVLALGLRGKATQGGDARAAAARASLTSAAPVASNVSATEPAGGGVPSAAPSSAALALAARPGAASVKAAPKRALPVAKAASEAQPVVVPATPAAPTKPSQSAALARTEDALDQLVDDRR